MGARRLDAIVCQLAGCVPREAVPKMAASMCAAAGGSRMSSPRMVKADVRLGGSAESPCHPNPSPMLPAHEPKRAKPRVPPAWASRRNKGHGSGPGCPGVGGGGGNRRPPSGLQHLAPQGHLLTDPGRRNQNRRSAPAPSGHKHKVGTPFADEAWRPPRYATHRDQRM